MYKWIVDCISSLFEPISSQNTPDLPGESIDCDEEFTRTCVKAAGQRLGSSARPAKRNYHSVYVTEDFCQSDQIEAKRRKRDVVITFVKKTFAGVTRLLWLHKRPTSQCEKRNGCEGWQPVTLMGIDELQMSWLHSTESGMDKAVSGFNEKSGNNPFQSSLPPLMRKYSGTALTAGLPDRGRDKERRGSLQLLPSRPVFRVGTANPDLMCSGTGHNRCSKPSLTVEEAIKQNDKEHYRRLLETVREKYSKSQPLPFSQTKPQDELLSQVSHKTEASGKSFDSVSWRVGNPAAPNVFTHRNMSATTNRWGGLTLGKSVTGSFEDTHPVRCAKAKQTAELDLSAEVATRLTLVDRSPSAGSIYDAQPLYTTYARHSDDDLPRLTREMAAEVSGALTQSDPNRVLSSAFKLRITQRDLATLQEGGWLNDEVINFYLSLIMERCSGEPSRLKVYSFSTFFFPKLRGGGQAGGHAAVKRWTKTVDLFLFDLILVPLHLGVHWAMAVIDFRSKTVKSYDSMGQRHDDICSLLLHYIKEEHKAKKGKELDSAKWTIGSLKACEIPQQKNGSDCGVFVCKYADFIAKEKSFTFKQCHMPLFRKLMIWEILHQKLL
uniref:Ubiquitin-like protease family profile domain-containing protein n=1 Tax=Oryzias latipes TaxID=8090 RepID=A0A3P9MD41_ORYLA